MKPNPQVPLVCVRCGYDLRAHRARGDCPECGLAVRQSLRAARRSRRIGIARHELFAGEMEEIRRPLVIGGAGLAAWFLAGQIPRACPWPPKLEFLPPEEG